MSVEERIPRRIIQTGRSREIGVRNRAAVAGLRCLNPDFDYMFFDDEQVKAFIEGEFPQYRDLFEGFPFRIQRFDFFRYLAVYRYGGFYFDLDVFLAAGLHGLLRWSCVFPFEGLTWNRYMLSRYCVDWEVGNYAFGAAAGHRFLEAVIENCVRGQRDPEWVSPMLGGMPRLFRSKFYVLTTSGPGLVTRTLLEHPELAESVTVLFPGDVCDTRSWHHFGELGVHMMDGSWEGQGGPIRRRVERVWNSWEMRRWMPGSVKLGKTRALPRADRRVSAKKMGRAI